MFPCFLSFHNSALHKHCQWDPQNLSPGSAMPWSTAELPLEQSHFQDWCLLPHFNPCLKAHHLWCRGLLLSEPWGWHGEVTPQSKLPPPLHLHDRKNRSLLSIIFLPSEISHEAGKKCPRGECSLDHNLACTIPNLLSSHAPGLVVSQLTFPSHC